MDRDDWQKAKELFDRAMALPPGERSAFLDRACEDDAELRKEVEDIVNSYDTDFLEEGAIAEGSELLGKVHFQAGKVIGRYHLKELIGTGGMGEAAARPAPAPGRGRRSRGCRGRRCIRRRRPRS